MRRRMISQAGEKRGDVLISRAMPVSSRRLGVSGECDVVEFHRAEKGISLHGYDGVFQVIPNRIQERKTEGRACGPSSAYGAGHVPGRDAVL